MTVLYPHSDLSTGRERLAGQELLDFVHANPTMTHRELCLGAGYFKELDNGSQGPNFIEFYEAILDAKNANGEYKIVTNGEYYEVNGRDWYEDVLDDQGRELYDAIEDTCPEFSKLDAEECQEFMDELSDLGITTAEHFNDAYYWQSDSWNAEAEFTEYVTTEVMCVDLPKYVCIDWQATWDCNLRYDFNTIEFDNETYFFSNNY